MELFFCRFFEVSNTKVESMKKDAGLTHSPKAANFQTNQNNKSQKLQFKDPFGNILLLKRALITFIGFVTYRRFSLVNKTKIIGTENLKDLPNQNVLFVSNHQTYFADVMAMYHIFSAIKRGKDSLANPLYVLLPYTRIYYIAAEETMKNDGLLPKIFSYAGAVTVKRAWRHKGKDVQRSSDYRAPAKIKKALNFGWVINFPQGTTAENAPVRKGAASLIRALNPIVVPVRIDGFRKAFGKRGLGFKQKKTQLSVEFFEPLQFEKDASVQEIFDFLEGHLLRNERINNEE